MLGSHTCRAHSSYSSTKALTFALSIDTTSASSYRWPRISHAYSLQARGESTSAPAGSVRPVKFRIRHHLYGWRPNHDGDVVIGDLQATLEAHRATNRASIIHPVRSDNKAVP